MSSPLLSVCGLELEIAGRGQLSRHRILRGVDLHIDDGESVALVGESGSGKSMTARSIVRLLPEGSLLSGDIRFRGESVLDMDERRLQSFRGADVAMIFQHPQVHLDPTRSIGDFLVETITAHSQMTTLDAWAFGSELLRHVRMDDATRRMNRYPHEFSGGMLQRVMIAAALACGAPLLLADEPTTALDVTVQADIVRMLSDLRRERQLAMLFITHDLELAEVACDRMIVMYAGQTVEVRETKDLVHSATHPYTIGLVRSKPSTATRGRRLFQLAGHPRPANEVTRGCAFVDRCPIAIERCYKENPPLKLIDGGLVACFRAEQSKRLLIEVRVDPRPLTIGSSREDIGPNAVEVVDVRRAFGGRRGIRRSYESVTAVNNVSFYVRRAESLAIVGESGSGKTTIARMLVGLDRPTSGTISICGKRRIGRRLEGSTIRASAKLIQIVFQDPYLSLDPRQRIGASVREVVRFATRLRGSELDERVTDVLERVGIDHSLMSRYPRALSGGQRQRVAIARALATEPAVLVLDEAVASLDASIQAQILNLLADLRSELAMAFVFITHDLAVVRQVADRVLVMHAGRIVESGVVDQIFNEPREDYTRRLIESAPSRMLSSSVAIG